MAGNGGAARSMVLFTLCCLPFVLGRGGKPIFTVCNETRSTFKTYNITSTPDIWYPGETITVDINGTLTKPVTGGQVEGRFYLAGLPVKGGEAICKLAPVLGKKCPMEAQDDFQVGPYRFAIPSFFFGKMHGSANMTDQDGDLIVCLKFWVDLGKLEKHD